MKPTTDSLILLFALGATAAAAQSGASAGVTAGAAKLSDTRSEQALTGIVQLQPRPWLTLSALTALVHVSDEVSGRPVLSNGAGDFPLVVGVATAFRAEWSPSVGAGAAYAIAGPLMLVIDGGHGLTSSSPRWVLSLGLGTAFASTSLVSPASPLGRQQTSFGGGVNRGSGSGKTGGCP